MSLVALEVQRHGSYKGCGEKKREEKRERRRRGERKGKGREEKEGKGKGREERKERRGKVKRDWGKGNMSGQP